MTAPATFAEIAMDLLRAAGCHDSPAQLLERWSHFISSCEEGYRWDVSEYDDEVAIRARLQALLEAPALRDQPGFQDLQTAVEEADRRFRALTLPSAERPERTAWWERAILRRAGQYYAQYIKDVYAIDVEIVGDRD